jgi:hypothetical protein
MQYVGLDFAASTAFFFSSHSLNKKSLVACLQSSVAVMVLISHTALAHGLRQSGPTSYGDIDETMSFHEFFLVIVLFSSFQYMGCICVQRRLET